MVNEFEAESNIKSDTGENLEDVGDKIKAGAKAVANKIKDPSKDLESMIRKSERESRLSFLFFDYNVFPIFGILYVIFIFLMYIDICVIVKVIESSNDNKLLYKILQKV